MLEISALLREFEKRGCTLIPVLLENASEEPELPPLLEGIGKVDFRKKDQRPYTSPNLKLEQEKRLLVEAQTKGEHLLAEARERGKLLQIEALNQRKSLMAEARERGKLLQIEALNQGRISKKL